MFDKVIGYQDEKLELSRVLDTILNDSKCAKIGVKTPRNILLYGEAGIGKSLLAGEFAKATEKKIYVIRKDQPNVNIFYNGRIEENGDENKSGWDPSLFKTKEDCLSYLKSHYGDNFSVPVYVIETVKVGNGWEVIDCERIGNGDF